MRRWLSARSENDFGRFAPSLERLIELKRREAEARAPGRPVYDELLDEYRDRVEDLIQLADLSPHNPVLSDIRGALERAFDLELDPRGSDFERTWVKVPACFDPATTPDFVPTAVFGVAEGDRHRVKFLWLRSDRRPV